MFVCYLCKVNLISSRETIKHLRLIHLLFDGPKLFIRCCSVGCSYTYNTFSGYRKHLLKHEGISFISDNTNLRNNNTAIVSIENAKNISVPNLININLDQTSEQNKALEQNLLSSDPETEKLDEIFLVKSLILQLISISLTEPQLQAILNFIKDFVEEIFSNIMSTEIGQNLYIINLFNSITQEIKKYSTAYRRRKFVDSMKYIKPKEIAIGHRTDNIYNTANQFYVEHNIPCTFQYIPILDTLKLLIEKNLDCIEEHLISNYVDGDPLISNGTYIQNVSIFKEKKYVIKLQLYYDDFETVNPLGSKTGSHKIGAFYFTLQNLPNIFNSHLDNIHLLALFYTSDLKLNTNMQNISINTILKPIINDIKVLESDGLIINGLDQPVFGTLVSLAHDNLAANILHGMVESFQANYYCRICLVHKNDVQNVFNDKQVVMRTYERVEVDYHRLGEENNYFGIKHKSVLNDLKYFKLFDSQSVDIMHDVLEGCVPLDIKLFLSALIESKLISLDLLNHRIALFHYGPLNQETKPSSIALDKNSSSIGQRAMQSWCLIRFLPLIINDLTIDYRVAVITENMLNELDTLVENHHKLFKAEFGHNLTPKLHFMVHYSNVIRRMGPLIRLWCIRYEGKHAILKNLTTKYKNFKNLIKTLATKVQQLTLFENNLMTNLIKGPFKIFPLGTLQEFKQLISNTVGEFSDDTEICICKWIKFGYQYHKGFVVCTGYEPISVLPKFEKIKDILIVDDSPLFVTWELVTTEYSETLKAFKLHQVENKINLIDLKTLIYKEPFNTHHTYNSIDTYVVPKYRFVF